MNLKNYTLDIKNQVAYANINNPKKANAMEKGFWTETIELMKHLDQNADVRVIVISGEGKHFSSGIDLSLFLVLQGLQHVTIFSHVTLPPCDLGFT